MSLGRGEGIMGKFFFNNFLILFLDFIFFSFFSFFFVFLLYFSSSFLDANLKLLTQLRAGSSLTVSSNSTRIPNPGFLLGYDCKKKNLATIRSRSWGQILFWIRPKMFFFISYFFFLSNHTRFNCEFR